MPEVKRISVNQRRSINERLKPYGVEVREGTFTEGKVWISLDKGCAATCNYKRLANLLMSILKGIFTDPSAIVVDGREFAF